MIWEGARTVAIDLDKTDAYNAAMPGAPGHQARRSRQAT